MRILACCSLMLLLGLPLAGTGQDKKDSPDEAKAKIVKIQLQVLTQATQVYCIINNEFPKQLTDLFDGKRKYLESRDELIDPWKKPYQYHPAGPRNKAVKPDIWTVTPSKETIGNWQKEKK